MNDALNAPIRRARRELNSADIPVEQKDDILMQDDAPIEHSRTIEHAHPDDLVNGMVEQLAFNEQPVSILIYPSREKNPPLVVDCWVNGRGAEVFVGGKWHEFNCLPINIEVTTKRKYVEALAMSKHDTIDTDVGSTMEENPHNRIRCMTSATVAFTVTKDASPHSAEWLRRIMSRKH